jgi:ribosomal protein S18 acetylase RimI-like enzyme
MSVDAIEFREETATKEDVQAHLEECSGTFTPNLRFKVDIEEYSTKIKSQARTFEAWSGKSLVGLVAAYMNDYRTRIGFVTSVSVAKDFMGRGIASALLGRCIERSRHEGMKAIRLEVGFESQDAIRLYKNFGFSEIAREGGTVSMQMEIGEKSA